MRAVFFHSSPIAISFDSAVQRTSIQSKMKAANVGDFQQFNWQSRRLHHLPRGQPMSYFRLLACLLCSLLVVTAAAAQTQPLVYQGDSGPGVGKHIVFLAGDHEYRGEQTCPMLARILAKHFGFKCTVLFSLDKKTGEIVPGSSYMPGTEALNDADLAVFFLRFQNFPADQMQPIVDYLDRAGPVVGLRTSTHAFQIPKDSTFAKYDHRFPGADYQKGFGRQVLGETWVSHYGRNHVMSTRLDIVEAQKDHPILRGVKHPWVQSGGYWTDPMPDSTVLAMTQPLESMEKTSPPAADKQPCPNSWTRMYSGKDGKQGRVFTSTSGASEDILDDDYRRMLVNACFWAVGMEDAIEPDNDVSFVGKYNPSTFQMNAGYFVGVKPNDLAGWETPIMPDRPLKGRSAKKKPAAKTSATTAKDPRPAKKTATKKTPDAPSSVKATAVKLAPKPKSDAALDIELGDHLSIIGNGLGESLQHHNYFETLLHQNFSDKQLTVRNLCFPGDTVDLRLRSLDFGEPDVHLAHSKTDAVLYFFGSNESFLGDAGREAFYDALTKDVEHTKQQDYSESGTGTKVVLVSPIAFEKTGDPNLPAGDAENERLKAYTDTIKQVANEQGVGFVDLFTPTKQLFDESPERLTQNGFTLNDAGYRRSPRSCWQDFPARNLTQPPSTPDSNSPSMTKIFIGGIGTEPSTVFRSTAPGERLVRTALTTTAT